MPNDRAAQPRRGAFLRCFPRKGDFPVRYQLVSVLSALLLCLTMLAAIVYGVGTQPALMQTLMLRTAPPEATGFPAEQYGAAAKLITDYLKSEGDFQLVFSMNGIAYNAFNEREQTHMADVRALFSLCRRFSLGSILLTLVGWLYSRKQRFFWRIVRRTACCMLAMDFDRLVILFHQIAFTNNLWLLNPQTDLLIRLMPTQLFIDYAQIIGIVWAALMGILLIIATVKLRNQQ